jgi:hypothetical protein
MVTLYHHGLTAAGLTAGMTALPHNGLSLLWLLIGTFALLMAAGALARLSPRFKQHDRAPSTNPLDAQPPQQP